MVQSVELLNLTAGEGLASGLFPGLPLSAVPLWADGRNVTFNSGMVQKAHGVTGIADLSARPTGMRAGKVGGERRLHFGAGGSYYRYRTLDGVQALKTGLSSGIWIIIPWGNHLVLTNGQSADGLRYWNGSVDAQITTPFTHANGIFKYRKQVFAYGTSNGDVYIERCAVNDPNTWTPSLTNDAGATIGNDLNGGLLSAQPLGDIMGLYTEEALSLYSYLGSNNITYSLTANRIKGIGALGHYSIIPIKGANFGLMMNKAFVTDGSTAQFIDDPQIREWLKSNVNWDRASEVYGWHDQYNSRARWTVPVGASEVLGIGFGYDGGGWTIFDDDIVCGEESGIWPYTMFGQSDRLLRQGDAAVRDLDSGAFESYIYTKPSDLGRDKRIKRVDSIGLDLEYEGTVSVTIGHSTNANGPVTWGTAQTYAGEDIFPYPSDVNEARYFALKISSSAVGAWWQLSGLRFNGEYTAHVD